MPSPPDPRPHVVIVGAGFAGIYAAKAMGRVPVRVTVIDRRNHHLFQPMLYQVATAALSPDEIAAPIRSIVRHLKNVDVILGEVVGIDPAGKKVHLDTGSSVNYDYLIVAIGSRHSYFSHPEWESLAPGLKDIEDAIDVRSRILMAFERAELETDPVKRQALLTFVVVGGGPTGVEVAGALAEIRRYALMRDFRHIDSREATIILLEASPRILQGYPESLSYKAKLTLRRLGVDVREQTMVTDIEPGAVHAAGWRIPSNTVVWAAGNTVSDILASLGAERDRQGRVFVDQFCNPPGHPEIYVLGDASQFKQGDGFVPGICPAAIQQGKYAARAIDTQVRGRQRRPFHYFDKGQLAVIGRGRAVADVRQLHFSGYFAWLLWVFVHILFLIGFRNRLIVMTEWAWSYLTFQRGARVMLNEKRLRDKLKP